VGTGCSGKGARAGGCASPTAGVQVCTCWTVGELSLLHWAGRLQHLYRLPRQCMLQDDIAFTVFPVWLYISSDAFLIESPALVHKRSPLLQALPFRNKRRVSS
jgi:hypothetical protein